MALRELLAGRENSDFDGMLGAIRQHLGMDVAFISEFRDGLRIFRHVDQSDPPSPVAVGGSDPLEDSYCIRVADGRFPRVIPDTSVIPEVGALPATAAVPVGAHLAVPIVLSTGEVFGTLCCFSRLPDATLTERDAAMMAVFAEVIAGRIEAENSERQAEDERLQRLSPYLQGSGLTTVFQPIVHLRAGDVVGYEALSRFSGPVQRSPDWWFAEADLAGRGVELERMAFRAALQHEVEVPSRCFLTVNLSPRAVESGIVSEVVAEHDVSRLVIEITEHAEVGSYEVLLNHLRPFQRAGGRVAVDDAGAGFASFRHILKLQPDFIKIDVSLIRDVDRDPVRRALTQAIISFANDTGVRVIAEGIETASELAVLTEMGAHLGQGYLLGRPSDRLDQSVLSTSPRPERGSLRPARRSAGLARAWVSPTYPPSEA